MSLHRPARPQVIVSSSQRAIRVPRKKLADLIEFVARSQGVRVAEVDLAIVSADDITAINRRYLRHAGATDVISFDLSDDPATGLSLQLVICGDEAVRQATDRGLKPQWELMLYVVHGLLHQMGFDDQSIRGAAAMHAREEELLTEFLKSK